MGGGGFGFGYNNNSTRAARDNSTDDKKSNFFNYKTRSITSNAMLYKGPFFLHFAKYVKYAYLGKNLFFYSPFQF